MTLKTIFSAHAEAGLVPPAITQEQFNDALTEFRQNGMSIDGDNSYKRDLCDVVVGSLACGKQNNNPPPAGHWCEQFWEAGRAEGEQQEHLLAELTRARDQRAALLSAAKEALAVIDRIKPKGNGNGTQVRLKAAIDQAID